MLLDFHQATRVFCERATLPCSTSRRRFLVARERQKKRRKKKRGKKEKNNSTREIRSRGQQPTFRFPLSVPRGGRSRRDRSIQGYGAYRRRVSSAREKGNQDMKEREMTDKKVDRGTRDGGRTPCYEGKSSGRTQSRNSWEPISSDENTSLKASTVFQPGQFLFVAPFFFFFLFFSFLRISRVTSRGSRVLSTVLLHPRKVCAFAVNTLETVDECLVIRYLDFSRDRKTRRR